MFNRCFSLQRGVVDKLWITMHQISDNHGAYALNWCNLLITLLVDKVAKSLIYKKIVLYEKLAHFMLIYK
jgi:hypothetical protein